MGIKVNMNPAELQDISMRIAEFNLHANTFFKRGILGGDPGVLKDLKLERRRIIIYASAKYSGINIENYLRILKNLDDEGKIILDGLTDVKKLKEVIKHEWETRKGDNRHGEASIDLRKL